VKTETVNEKRRNLGLNWSAALGGSHSFSANSVNSHHTMTNDGLTALLPVFAFFAFLL
jgi:hypothetical protein